MGSKKTITIRTADGSEVEASKRSIITKTLNGYRHRQKPKNAAELEKRIAEYFQFCQDLDIVPSIEMLSAAIGTSRQSFFRWCNGQYTTADWQNICIRARQAVYASIETAGMEQEIPMPLAIFQMKSFGWSDSKPLDEMTGYAPEELAPVNPKALIADYRKQYGEIPDEDLTALGEAFIVDTEADTVELPEWL